MMRASGARLTWQDAAGRPLLEVAMASVEGGVSSTSGMEGPITLREARCRLFEDGKPTTWLNAPVAVWNAGELVASQGAKAGSLDGRMTTDARRATWYAEKKLLTLTAPTCRLKEQTGPALLAQGPSAEWTGGVLSLLHGVQGHTEDGITTMSAQRL